MYFLFVLSTFWSKVKSTTTKNIQFIYSQMTDNGFKPGTGETETKQNIKKHHKNESGFVFAEPEMKTVSKTLFSKELLNRSEMKSSTEYTALWSVHFQLSQLKKKKKRKS